MIGWPSLQSGPVRFALLSDPAVSVQEQDRARYLETGDEQLLAVSGDPTWIHARIPRGRDLDASVMSSVGAAEDAGASGVRVCLDLFTRCVDRIGPVSGPDGEPVDLPRERWEDAIQTEDRILVGLWLKRMSSAPAREEPATPLPSSRRRSKRRAS